MVAQDDNGSDVLLDAEDSWSNCDGWNEASDPFPCVLCPMEMETVQACICHCAAVHKFDFKIIKKTLGLIYLTKALDFFGCMKLVNYCRTSWTSKDFNADFVISTFKEWGANDEYLKPRLEDDPMLYAFEDDQSESESITVEDLSNEDVQELRNQLIQTNDRCQKLESQLEAYKAMVEETYMSQSVKELVISKEENISLKVGDADDGNYYFNSYASSEIHESMLRVFYMLITGCS